MSSIPQGFSGVTLNGPKRQVIPFYFFIINLFLRDWFVELSTEKAEGGPLSKRPSLTHPTPQSYALAM